MCIDTALLGTLDLRRQYVVLDVPKSDSQEAGPAAPVSSQIPNGLPWYGRLIASITTTNVIK